MNISRQEALSILKMWKDQGTAVKVNRLQAGARKELQAVVCQVRRTLVDVSSESGNFQIDLDEAEFNGDRAAPESSAYGAYLVCEFRNGDRYSFYANPRKP